jgi:hypothetical protein
MLKSRSVAAVIAAILAPAAVNATVLTFDLFSPFNRKVVPAQYGDNVAGTSDATGSYGQGAEGATPNVTVDYLFGTSGRATELKVWTAGGYGGTDGATLYNEIDGDDFLGVRLTAAPGFNVVLQSFDLGNYGAQVSLPSLSVVDGQAATLFESVPFTLPTTGAAIDFQTPLVAQQLTIALDLTGLSLSSDNVGLDNITFGERRAAVVPLPASALLLGSALAALGLRRRKA